MLTENSDAVMRELSPKDLVLDIGGWAHPFNRANYIMDSESYESRGFYNRTFAKNKPFPPIGGNVEFFSKSTWIQRDICDKTPFPFTDKELDYVICSHTLEDIRDPLWVCSEMIRVSKAGYIEVPSRVWETCRGMEPGIAGLSHHRWLIEISGNSIRFIPKFHRIHNWRYSLPNKVLRELKPRESVTWLFWENSFEFSEPFLHGEAQLEELDLFVRRTRPYPSSLLKAHKLLTRINQGQSRVAGRLRSMLSSPKATA
jgi:hypothetical protein